MFVSDECESCNCNYKIKKYKLIKDEIRNIDKIKRDINLLKMRDAMNKKSFCISH